MVYPIVTMIEQIEHLGMGVVNLIRAADADLPMVPRALPREHLLKRFSNRPCTTWGGRGTSARTDAGIVKLSRIRLTDPQDDGLESRREPGMLGVDHRDSA